MTTTDATKNTGGTKSYSRLDKLLGLLENGGSSGTREAAGVQIADLARSHPKQLSYVLSRIYTYLYHSKWETRVAAGSVVGLLVDRFPPSDSIQKFKSGNCVDEEEEKSLLSRTIQHIKQLEAMDVVEILQKCAPLKSSTGQEFETEDSEKDKKKQAQNIKKSLGGDLMDLQDLGIEDEDLSNTTSIPQPSNKRKNDQLTPSSSSSTSTTKQKISLTSRPSLDPLPTNLTPEEFELQEGSGWVFQSLADRLTQEVMHPRWEARHGSAVALRELLLGQASIAGLIFGDDVKSGEAIDGVYSWLTNCSVLLLHVLMLDRFSDFVGDQVVSPVRETIAQALGAAAAPLPLHILKNVIRVLGDMVSVGGPPKSGYAAGDWQVRHGGLLGLKYILAGRGDMAEQLIPLCLHSLRLALDDFDVDVQGMAAEALTPVAEYLATTQPTLCEEMEQSLWSILSDLDNLSSGSAPVMKLLAEIYKHKQSINIYKLKEFLPLLFPQCHHGLQMVRIDALQCLNEILCSMKRITSRRGSKELTDDVIMLDDEDDHVDENEESDIIAKLICGEVGRQGSVLRALMELLCVEPQPEVLELAESVWQQAVQMLPQTLLENASNSGQFDLLWQLATTPSGKLPDRCLALYICESNYDEQSSKRRKIEPKKSKRNSKNNTVANDLNSIQNTMQKSNEMCGVLQGPTIQHRLAISRCLATLCQKFDVKLSGVDRQIKRLQNILMRNAAACRLLVAFTVQNWMLHVESTQHTTDAAEWEELTLLRQKLFAELICQLQVVVENSDTASPSPTQENPYTEVERNELSFHQDLKSLVQTCNQRQIHVDIPPGFNPDSPTRQVSRVTLNSLQHALQQNNCDDLQYQFQRAQIQLQTLVQQETYLHKQVLGSVASALICAAINGIYQIPDKLNGLIKPLMGCLRSECQQGVQKIAGMGIARLAWLVGARQPSPNEKLIGNLLVMACGDPTETPRCNEDVESELENSEEKSKKGDLSNGSVASNKDGSGASRLTYEQVARQGAEAALEAICDVFKSLLFVHLPIMWTAIAAPFAEATDLTVSDSIAIPIHVKAEPGQIACALQLLKVLPRFLDPILLPQLVSLVPHICGCCLHHLLWIREQAARAVAKLCNADEQDRIATEILRGLIPAIKSSMVAGNAVQGAVRAVEVLTQELGQRRVLPFVIPLVLPLLGRMADGDQEVRRCTSRCFGTLVPLIPLAQGVAASQDLMQDTSNSDAIFISQLIERGKIGDVPVPKEIKTPMRPYQHEGLNWLAFLRQVGLNGILADDMGLGKTVQALSIVLLAATAHNESNLPSLVVCPSTLTSHWAYEIQKNLDFDVLLPVHFGRDISNLGSRHVVIASYENLRAAAQSALLTHKWLYCVLDEGHIIKNHASKLSSACKQIDARHRLILTGTPIHNDLLEVWNLFDFLMPGFLGTQKEFNANYGKAVRVAKTSKKISSNRITSKNAQNEAQKAFLAVERLHKQLMPFILRRTKEEVLKELPPKLIQDVLCDMTPIQSQLYELISKGRQGDATQPGKHMFSVLQALRRLCTHPVLSFDPKSSEHLLAAQQYGNGSIQDGEQAVRELYQTKYSPKFVMLADLLWQCGIGNGSQCQEAEINFQDNAAEHGHKVLLFAQIKSTLDLVEDLILKPQGIVFLRLDGGLDAGSRFQVAQRFNSDPSIDVLLLTTQVGGLGLNLTAADTVIFMEHDWNPMKDNQAMDRAHRLGQHRTVTVYRLLTRSSFEERVMSLQEFKKEVADGLVNADNISMDSMDTQNLLDLVAPPTKKKSEEKQDGKGGKKGLQGVLSNLQELWDDSQYKDEFNVDKYLTKAKGNYQGI